MIVEHTFVTTLADALWEPRARALFGSLGFTEMSATPGRLEFRRGVEKARHASRPDELPQQLRIEFDRGRVTLAISVIPHGNPGARHRSLLLVLAELTEKALTPGADCAPAVARMQELADQYERSRRRHRLWVGITATALVLAIAALVAVVVYS